MSTYRDTLNLPKTNFDMRANLTAKEPKILEEWYRDGIYEAIQENRKDAPLYILHDGPPYANGDIHVGTAFNKILKDIIVKYKTMQGFRVPYVPGWDCHGQPIEHNVEKALGTKKSQLSQAKIRELCKEFAFKFLNRQRDQFKRLGVFGDWDKPYLTLDPQYEVGNIEVFKAMYQRGLIYQGTKPIHWCAKCKTALAEAEIEYMDERSNSIYVKMSVVTGASEFLSASGLEGKSLSVLVWTTTPWTLPANVAVALHPNEDYSVLSNGADYLVIASTLVASVGEEADLDAYSEVKKVKGSALEQLEYKHPIYEDKVSKTVFADFVSMTTGAGAVHIAPGHGQEDYLVGQKYKLPSPMPVDDDGNYMDGSDWLTGMSIYDANPKIIEFLRDNGTLLASGELNHSYPHCWRCKSPVIFRATKQWFISMEADGLRDEALKEIEKVKWVPGWSIRRIQSMVNERPDWCISRQRDWGVPIPVFYCRTCGELLATEESFNKVLALFAAEGADAWFTKEAAEILGSDIKCGCGGTEFDKEKDILDVWFESGVSNAAVLKKRLELAWPADMYLEGSDQHRGWFQSSLFCSVGAFHAAPFKSVLTHGFVVDGDGRKMSKSLGNVVDPLDVISKSGADILRLWVASQDYSVDVAISPDILTYISDAYRRIRNTVRFLHGNLDGFDPAVHAVSFNDMLEIDKWALSELDSLVRDVTDAFEAHTYHLVFHRVYNFCVTQMSSFYLDIIKDRMYTSKYDSAERRSAQTAIIEIIATLTKLLAPVLSFTTEEIWAILPDHVKEHTSIHLASYPKSNVDRIDQTLIEKWEALLLVRSDVLKALEIARKEKLIGNSLEAAVHVYCGGDEHALLEKFGAAELASLFLVSEATYSDEDPPEDAHRSQQFPQLGVSVVKAVGDKCERCWNYRKSVGQHSEHPTLCVRCIEALS